LTIKDESDDKTEKEGKLQSFLFKSSKTTRKDKASSKIDDDINISTTSNKKEKKKEKKGDRN